MKHDRKFKVYLFIANIAMFQKSVLGRVVALCLKYDSDLNM